MRPFHEDDQTERLLLFFQPGELPAELAAIVRPFGDLAQKIIDRIPEKNAERTACLQRLLEAKDWAIRAHLEYRGG